MIDIMWCEWGHEDRLVLVESAECRECQISFGRVRWEPEQDGYYFPVFMPAMCLRVHPLKCARCKAPALLTFGAVPA